MIQYRKIYLFILLATTLSFNLIAQNSNNKVTLTVNKKFELLYAMYLSTNIDSILINNKHSGFPLVTQKDFELKRKFYEKFSKYKDSPQVQFYNAIAGKGFLFGAPFNALIRVDTSLNIIDSCYFKQLPLPKEAKESVVLFTKRLKEFCDLSEFNDFYNYNKSLYDTIIKTNKEIMPLENLVSSTEDFFGWKLNGYHVVLVPMMWPGGLSFEYKKHCIDSLTEVYICIGPKSVESNVPKFGTKEEFKSVIVHEFVHPFVSHYCMKYREQINQYAALYNKNENTYRNNGCPDWFSAINELLTRTVEIIINSNNENEKIIKAIDYQSKDLGFSYIPVLYKAFDKYYSPKVKVGTNLDTVFLDIIHSLDESEQIK
jgi:hypothetical protein